jgi:hypothetical protein
MHWFLSGDLWETKAVWTEIWMFLTFFPVTFSISVHDSKNVDDIYTLHGGLKLRRCVQAESSWGPTEGLCSVIEFVTEF